MTGTTGMRGMGGRGVRGPILVCFLLLAPALAGCLGASDDAEPLSRGEAAGEREGLAPSVYDTIGDRKVRIHRDAQGVPHVYADTEEALFFGEGYAQAEDRAFQMEILRRAAKGRLAEILGEPMLGSDVAMRRQLASEPERWAIFSALAARDRDALAAHADGVNAGLAAIFADPRRTPVEFAGLADPPKPWTVTDTLAILELMMQTFAEDGGDEVANAHLLLALEQEFGPADGRRMFDDRVWYVDPESPPTIDPADLSYEFPPPPAEVPAAQRALLSDGVLSAGAEATRAHEAAYEALRGIGVPMSWGSNALLVSGRLTESGRPILLGGPQTGLFIPSLLWEVGLHGAGFDAVGVIPPGLPGIAIGRTRHAAWTITSGQSDNVDTFVVLLDESGTKYRQGESWAPLRKRTETFLVNGAPPRVEAVDLLDTHYGPVVAVSDDGRHAIVRAAAIHDGLEASVLCIARLGTATTLLEFSSCVRELSGNFNFYWADDGGHIAYFHVGRFPERRAGFDPRLPIPGDGTADWTGWYPASRLPRIVDPPSGWLANWNNLPAKGWPSGDSRNAFGKMHRVGGLQRIAAAAIADGPLSVADVEVVNRRAATSDVFAFHFEPILAAAAPGPARDAILDWIRAGAPIVDADADGSIDHEGAAYWEAFHAALHDRILADELGEGLPEAFYAKEIVGANADGHGGAGYTLLLRALEGSTRHDWADDRSTPERESAAHQHQEALSRASQTFGERLAMPRHTMVALGAATPPTFDRMNRGSYNQVVELSTPLAAWNVLPPGNSGTVTAAMAGGAEENPHLADQLALYTGFAYKVIPFTIPEVEGAAEATLELDVVRTAVVPLAPPIPLPGPVPGIGVLGELGT
ncbi:MAG: penicillin acylase family protein [Methanobacteriota archaeon]